MDKQRDKVERPPMVAYAAFEEMVTIHERHVKRLFIGLLVAIILLAASNMAWLWFWSGFDFSEETYSDDYYQTGDGRFNLNVGEQGDVSYGETGLQEDLPQTDNDTP